MPRYRVMVDDNFHYHEDDRREHGTYETLEQAIAACHGIIDKSLAEEYHAGMTAEALYDRYMSFGDDPFIVVVEGPAESAKFSAWRYAKERCQAICPQ